MDVPKTLKDLETYCAYYNEIGKRCKQQGLQFGYHNHAHVRGEKRCVSKFGRPEKS